MVSKVIRDPLVKLLMGPLETKDTKVCGVKQYERTRALIPTSFKVVHISLTHGRYLTYLYRHDL